MSLSFMSPEFLTGGKTITIPGSPLTVSTSFARRLAEHGLNAEDFPFGFYVLDEFKSVDRRRIKRLNNREDKRIKRSRRGL